MKRPTHILDWDVMIPIKGSPVLFAEFAVEFTAEEGSGGLYAQASKLHFDAQINSSTPKNKKVLTIEVPSDHQVKSLLGNAFKNEDWQECFDILLASLVSRKLQNDAALIEKIS